jgi:hypothetical protein
MIFQLLHEENNFPMETDGESATMRAGSPLETACANRRMGKLDGAVMKGRRLKPDTLFI